MTRRLYRPYGLGYLHFITSSCYQRRPFLNTPHRRSLFVQILEEARKRYHFVVVGYVVMPEHIHLIISEPEHGTPSTVMLSVSVRRNLAKFGSLGTTERTPIISKLSCDRGQGELGPVAPSRRVGP